MPTILKPLRHEPSWPRLEANPSTTDSATATLYWYKQCGETEKRGLLLADDRRVGNLGGVPCDSFQDCIRQYDGDTIYKEAGTRVTKLDRRHAAEILQRFFSWSKLQLKNFRIKQATLMDKIARIERQKLEDLSLIEQEKEARRLEILRQIQLEVELDAKALVQKEEDELTIATVDQLKREIKDVKRGNAYLHKRCIILRKCNETLWQNSNRQLRINCKVHGDIKKLKQGIKKGKEVLSQCQRQIEKERSNLAALTESWRWNKHTNKKLRQCMNQITNRVETCMADDSFDKWELVDRLYLMQRNTRWERKCNATIKSRGLRKLPNNPDDRSIKSPSKNTECFARLP